MANKYQIKEMFYTLQGEGYYTGRAAVFVRFTGCNLWSGREVDRADAICSFCDTEFVGTDGQNGGKYNGNELALKIKSLWPTNATDKIFVVMTGGEPLLQIDDDLIQICHKNNIYIAVETNGTILPPKEIDWICFSPKAGSKIIIKEADEIKIVYPQLGSNPKEFESDNFSHLYLQPMDGLHLTENIKKCIAFIKAHPKWRLSVQTHKVLGID